MGNVGKKQGQSSRKHVNSSTVGSNIRPDCSNKVHCIIKHEVLQTALQAFSRESNICHFCHFCHFEKESTVSVLAQQVFQQIQNPPYQDQELKERYIKIKIQEWQIHIQASLKCNDFDHKMQANRLLINEVQQFLLANIKNTPSLIQLAHRFATNEKKLNQQFKQSLNMTVFSWIREQRMQKATNLLQQGKHSIKKIAQDCGFKHPSDFTTSFKKKFQLTPMAFKKQAAKKYFTDSSKTPSNQKNSHHS